MQQPQQQSQEQVVRPDAAQTSLIRAQLERMKFCEEHRPELFRANLDNNDIMRAAHSVRQAAMRGASPEALFELQPAFAVQFPVMFEKCCVPSVPLSILPLLLDQFRALKSNYNESSKEDATNEVCRFINKECVDPKLRELHSKKYTPANQ